MFMKSGYSVNIKLAFSLFLVSILQIAVMSPGIAASKIVPGSNCAKAGITQNYNGKKFTCIKLGSKLYWNNGISIPKLNNQFNIPATCTVISPQWRTLSELGSSNTDGYILLSALIVNSSPSFVATNVRIVIEWFDSIGLSNRQVIRIPRIYPGTVPFGDISSFSYNGLDFPEMPQEIKVTSSCGSSLLDRKELINGSMPVISGKAPITVETVNGPVYPESQIYANLVVTNIFKKELIISGERPPANANIYGFIKDKFGNILSGYNGWVAGDLFELSPGDSTKVQMWMFEGAGLDPNLLNRFAFLEYVIIPD